MPLGHYALIFSTFQTRHNPCLHPAATAVTWPDQSIHIGLQIHSPSPYLSRPPLARHVHKSRPTRCCRSPTAATNTPPFTDLSACVSWTPRLPTGKALHVPIDPYSLRMFVAHADVGRPAPEREQPLDATDAHWLRQAFVWANAARLRGNRPFGAVIVAEDGRILAEAFSNTRETGDSTGHAEMNALRQLARPRLSPEVLSRATLYTSAEPCVMCAGAMCSAGIRRVVFGLDAPSLHRIRPDLRPNQITCHNVFATSHEPVDCIGPSLLQEALAVYEDNWFSP